MSSGRIEKSVPDKGLTLYVDWVSTPDVRTNSSVVNTKIYLKYYSLTVGVRDNNYIDADGQKVVFSVPSISHSGSYQTRQIYERNFTVPHGADGIKWCNIKAFYNITIAGLASITAENNVYLDPIDTAPPNMSFSLNEIAQTNLTLIVATDVTCDLFEYSIDGGGTWQLISNTPGTSARGIISALIPYTDYTVVVRVKKQSNQVYGYSQAQTFKTLPIYISSISASDKSVNEGGFVNLSAVVSPSNATIKTLNFTSSNTNVASVDSTGKITGISKGSATITAMSTDGSGISKSITVSVKRPVTGVTITQNLNIQMGEANQLIWSVLPSSASNLAVTFSSSDVNIAAVSSTGLAVGVGIGSCDITVTTSDGGYTAQCAIEVIGDIAWTPIEPLENLAWWDINAIYNNMLWIRAKLLEKGHTAGNLVRPDVSNEYSTALTEIKNILNVIEEDLWVISRSVLWDSSYYEEKYVWQKTNTDKKSKVARWVMYLNDCYSVINGIVPAQHYLRDKNGDKIVDINNEIICCEGIEF